MLRSFKLNNKKSIMFLISALVIGLILVGVTLAVVIVETDKLINEFVPGEVSISHSEDGLGVINDGDQPVYVRAALVFTWTSVDQENMIMSKSPVENVDYEYTCNSGWVRAADGFWYYTSAIEPGMEISMVASLTDKGTAPLNYKLSAELLLDAVQSLPVKAVMESFESGVSSVSADGTLTVIPY